MDGRQELGLHIGGDVQQRCHRSPQASLVLENALDQRSVKKAKPHPLGPHRPTGLHPAGPVPVPAI